MFFDQVLDDIDMTLDADKGHMEGTLIRQVDEHIFFHVLFFEEVLDNINLSLVASTVECRPPVHAGCFSVNLLLFGEILDNFQKAPKHVRRCKGLAPL
jgi:hypothetical protein